MTTLNQLPEEIITEISMSERKGWLILEGDSDKKIFSGKKFFNDAVYIVANGWENVQLIVSGCDSFEKQTVVGLIDRDYRDFNGKNPKHPKIVITDYRDIENILFESNALCSVYTEYGSTEKLPKKGKDSIDFNCVKKEINNVAVKIGKYRAYCYCHDINISFDDLDYDKFVDKDLSFNNQKFIKHLMGKKNNCALMSSIKWTDTQSDEWIPKGYCSPVFICNGHDLMAVVAISLKKKYGNQKGSIDHEEVESLFRLAIDKNDLQQYKFWKNLEQLLAS